MILSRIPISVLIILDRLFTHPCFALDFHELMAVPVSISRLPSKVRF